MNKTKVDTFILTNQNCFADNDIPMIRECLENAEDSKWQSLSLINLKDPQIALMLSIFGGPIGIDRIYIGDTLLGILKTITCGGLLIWAFFDMFLITEATKDNNKHMLMNILNQLNFRKLQFR
ncbi:MAG: TM2 domain-containing protein [Prevotella sp.]|nr:TM2 domain-containing protein [Prevotella sp.]